MIRELYLVQLTVANCPASLRWYQEALGAKLLLMREPEGFALLRLGGGRVALKAGTPIPGNTLLTFEVANLEAELARLATNGLHAQGPVQVSAEGYRSAIFTDPDGHRISLFEWTSREKWRAAADP